MKKLKQLMGAALMGVVVSVAHAADTTVPGEWNVDPLTGGASLEQFTNRPIWAVSGTLRDGSARSDRFWSATTPEKVLGFATPGMTNTFEGAKIQPGTPLFVDMRCKLTLLDAVTPAIPTNTILSFFANAKSNLVAVVGTQCQTNTAITVLTNELYSIMIRFATDKFDLFFTNSVEPVLSFNVTTNKQIGKLVVSGAGEMDDLYISYGDPRRDSTNYVNTPKPFASPANVDETVINNWVANQAKTNSSLVGLSSITSANAVKYYLTDTALATNVFAGELGIGSFTYNPSRSNVTVVVTLKTGADSTTTRKKGKINGVLKLKGAATYAASTNGTWTSISEVAKIGADDFTDGVATYTFTLPNTTYKFFLPVIQSNIQ
jgi:hypothetical protein